MAKLIELTEAAQRLGITPEELTEMRSRNEIFGYRDGANWKFKPEEIERVANEMGLGAAADAFAADIPDLTADAGTDDELIDVADLKLDDEGDDDESILVTEEELGRSDDSTSSTIIGKAGLEVPASESDIKPTDDSLTADSDIGGSDLSLADDLELDLGDLESTSDSDVLAADAEESPGSSLKLADSDALSIGDEELNLEDDSTAGSGIGAIDSSIDLDLDDDDLVSSGSSSSGSDVTLGASDSGINLTNPSDSGISLEDVPADLGSGIDSSLDLGDEEMIELEGEPADAEEATELQADEEFLLTPVSGDAELDEESDDSGSQVIALDGDELDESAATMLVADDDGPLVAEEGDFTAIDELGAGPAAATAGAPAAVGTAATVEEADFSAWNIVGLSMLSVFMGICGLLALDLIRNIWSWDKPYPLNSTIMDFIVGML